MQRILVCFLVGLAFRARVAFLCWLAAKGFAFISLLYGTLTLNVTFVYVKHCNVSQT